MVSAATARGAAVGYVVDRALGEPPSPLHPVVWFGSAMAAVEQATYRSTRAAGLAYAAAGLAIGVSTGAAVGVPFRSSGGSTAVATAVAVAGRSLGEAALGVDQALARGDLAEARRCLPALVGRDPDGLDEVQICRAVVESVAENTVDAVVAPLLAAAVGGAPAVLAHRAINTMDAMVGYRSPRYEAFGWSAARLDDAANWLPARVTAVLVALARPHRARAVAGTLPHARLHPSPNAGVAEAAFAAALGLQLGGPCRYDGRLELRPVLGDGRLPTRQDIGRACRLSQRCGSLLAAALLASGLLVDVVSNSTGAGPRPRSSR